MPRADKVAVIDEVSSDLADSAATLLTDYRGLTVTELGQLRDELRKAGASYKVVKNTLARRAASAAGIEGLDDFLVGPTALVFCGEDPVGPAKALKAFAKDHPALLVKAGFLDGEVLDEAATLRLADLESREELLAKLAGLMYGALANFARLLQAPLSQQARLVQALVDAGGAEAKGFAPTSAAEAAEEAGEDTAGIVETVADTAAGVVEAAAGAVANAADAVAEAVTDEDDAEADDDERAPSGDDERAPSGDE